MNSLLGALIGDAAGATLEGFHREITKDMANHSMTMPGGGIFKVGSGQITDDGELTLSLWRALQSSHPSLGFPIFTIIKHYSDWYESIPFDIGQTCSFAFECLHEFIKDQIEPFDHTIQTLKKQIYHVNRSSQANGALMRATAIATWIAPYHDVSAEQAAEFAMQDASLSHPHRICQETNAIYVYAIVHLLRGLSPKDVLEYTSEFVSMNEFSDEVKHWYNVESLDISSLDCTKQIGHVRWGFVLAFYFLRHPTISYDDAIRDTLMKGGDTDTNACIVGGVVGCYQPIPFFMKNPVLEFNCTKEGNIRPMEYSVQFVIGDWIDS